MLKIKNNELGEKIRELRKAAGHTQDDLADLLKQKRQVISYFENGERVPSVQQLMMIAFAYGTTVDYLLGLSNTPTSDKDISFICNYTGLSDEAVKLLNILTDVADDNFFKFANTLVKYLYDYQFIIERYYENLEEFKKLFPEMINCKIFDNMSECEQVKHFENFSDVFDKLMVNRYRLSSNFNNLFYDKDVAYTEKLNLEDGQCNPLNKCDNIAMSENWKNYEEKE